LLGIRETLEEKTRLMALVAKKIIEENVRNLNGSPVKCIIYSGSIGCGEEAARCEEEFSREHVCATLSVTPSWCYGAETIDMNPLTVKAVWGFNGTERPGAVYLACAMAVHNQKGLPAFSIYGEDVQDLSDESVPEDVKKKLIQFAKCAVVVGAMQNKAYVGIGSVSMGIIGSFCSPEFYQKYLGMRTEWIDMTEILRRESLHIYDEEEFQKALVWVKENCKEGYDKNHPSRQRSRNQKDEDWVFVVKMTLIIRDIMIGNDKLKAIGWKEESLGRNALFGGFQGQRMWTDWKPNGDFSEAILSSTFDWNGKRAPLSIATENDNLNGLCMLFTNLLTGKAALFADVRTYWSNSAVKRVTGWEPEGLAKDGFIHLINSGAACLDATAAVKDDEGNRTMKAWWDMSPQDIQACLSETDWCPAELCQFRGGGFSSHFNTSAEMPLTMLRINIIDGIGPVLQIAEGWSTTLPLNVYKVLDERTDPTWPTTWFVPRTTGENAFSSVYSVMANWGANHGVCAYGHIGSQLITLSSMLRIPVSMHNVNEGDIFRPHAWSAFGTHDLEAADYKACQHYGPIYR
jgi:L-fucose isomerase